MSTPTPTPFIRLTSSMSHAARVPIFHEPPFEADGARELDQIRGVVLHEPGGCHSNPLGADPMEKGLRRRGYGVHFDVGVNADGTLALVQHNPLSDIVSHASAGNTWGIGIEVRTPYYPPARPPWQDIITMPNAHKGKYVLPLPVQVEGAHQLILSLHDALPDQLGEPTFQNLSPALQNGRLAAGVIKGKTFRGVLAHKHLPGDQHSDGLWPLIYHALRLSGLDPAAAYEQAVKRAAARGAFDLRPVFHIP